MYLLPLYMCVFRVLLQDLEKCMKEWNLYKSTIRMWLVQIFVCTWLFCFILTQNVQLCMHYMHEIEFDLFYRLVGK